MGGSPWNMGQIPSELCMALLGIRHLREPLSLLRSYRDGPRSRALPTALTVPL